MQQPWNAQRVRTTFLRFFRERGHAVIPSASLIPENDPSVLFTTAGMHPLVPYLLGEPHPAGKRLTNVQKCIRTSDIDEVGDAMHLTFFEMLGNWSLGDYFKEDAIRWSYELLTGPEWFAIDPQRLAVSCFVGDADAPRDEVSAGVWRSLGIPEERIAYLGKDDNWWPAGGKYPGPQGPDTEMFVWTGAGSAPARFDSSDKRWIEVWNDVFMEFSRTQDGAYEPLVQKNVDTGMGLERMLMVLEGKTNVYETDLFLPFLEAMRDLTKKFSHIHEQKERERRIAADHLRAATFILGDPFGVAPSNVDQGYVVRKLIRRAIRAGRSAALPNTGDPWTPKIADAIIAHYGDAYPELRANASRITFELREEEERFREVLERGEPKYFALVEHAAEQSSTGPIVVAGEGTFRIYESYGFPFEMMQDLARDWSKEFGREIRLNPEVHAEAERKHQEQSRAATGQRFHGGLADHSDQSIRYHTATHLAHQALRSVLGSHVEQRGSNITPERMRFDFAHGEKLTLEQLRAVERLVQEHIDADFPVSYALMDAEQAKASGVIGLFDDQYASIGGKVKVYSIGDASRGYFSQEICGGPHVARTGMIGKFHITKEEACARGIRRIRAVVHPPGGSVAIAGEKTHG